MVYFPKGMCREIVEKNAPTSYIQHARNPERSVKIGENTTVFAPNYGSPFVFDLDNGRRYGTIEDFENAVKLVYDLPHLHHSGGTVANRSTCRSTSGISTWCTPTSSTATSPTWAR